MIQQAADLLLAHKNLTGAQMRQVMEEIMSGSVQTQEIISFLTALNEQVETSEEVTAAAEVMFQHAIKVQPKKKNDVILDTCGTGGDKKHTFNISTAVAFVASGAGITVAKHGNRSVSSKSGSADVLEALGININMRKEKIEQCLDEIGIAFLFAPNFHPAMKYVAEARKAMGVKTIFNFLGPLCNPAGATHQLIGVPDTLWAGNLAGALSHFDRIKHALVVRGEDNMDEISTRANTSFLEVRKGQRIVPGEINPTDYFASTSKIGEINTHSIKDSKNALLGVLNREEGPHRDIVLLNAGAAIYVADKTKASSVREGIREGIELAEESIDSGAALEKLELLKKYSNEP